MVKRPTAAFWDASHATDDQRKSGTLADPLDLNPARDKDNAEQSPKPPSFAPGGASNKAPKGTMGYRETPSSIEPSYSPDMPNIDWTVHGSISTMEGYNFSLKLSELPSERNLDGGKVESLVILKNNQSVANFDKGWKVEARDRDAIQAVEKVREVFRSTSPRIQVHRP
jgi:hypothetical protein